MIKQTSFCKKPLSKYSSILYNQIMSLKKYLPTLILIVLVYGWYFFVHMQSHPSKLNVLGASTNLVLYVQPDTGHQPLLDAINSAKQEVLVEVYLLSDKQIIDALEDAK